MCGNLSGVFQEKLDIIIAMNVDTILKHKYSGIYFGRQTQKEKVALKCYLLFFVELADEEPLKLRSNLTARAQNE